MRALFLVLTLLFGFAAPAGAAEEATAAQAAIRGQIAALSRDDAAAAYEFAAPAIQRMFPDPSVFMNMVRNGYPPVYRHRSYAFAESGVANGAIVQKVDIVDNDGVLWAALYSLEQQPDGSLKITGCTLIKVGQSV